MFVPASLWFLRGAAGLKEILLMVSSQWDQLQRQIRRQHGWMLRTLRCIQARLLYMSQSHEPITSQQRAASPLDDLKVEPVLQFNDLASDRFYRIFLGLVSSLVDPCWPSCTPQVLISMLFVSHLSLVVLM